MEREVRNLWIASVASAPFIAAAVYVPNQCEFRLWGGLRLVSLDWHSSGPEMALLCSMSLVFLALAIPRRNRHVGCTQVALGAGCLSLVLLRYALDPRTLDAYLTVLAVLALQILSGWTKAVGWAESSDG